MRDARTSSARVVVLRFLVVDDERMMRIVVGRWIREAFPAAAVDEAASGEDALRLLEGLPPGDLVVVSDHRMPGGMDGIAFLAEVGKRRPGARRILLTGYAREEVEPRLAGGGIDAVLEKGASYEAFEAAVAALVFRAATPRGSGPDARGVDAEQAR